MIRIAFAIAITFNLYSAHANLGTYKHGKLINPDTNKPYTGNLEVANNDWGNDSVVSTDTTVGLATG